MSDIDWQEEAKAADRRRLAPWIGTAAVAAVAGAAFGGAAVIEAQLPRTILIAIGAAAALAALAWGTLIYMRVIDEQERDANLWGCYVGMCAYLALYTLRLTFYLLRQPPPFSHDVIFFAVMVIVLAVFAWKRFC